MRIQCLSIILARVHIRQPCDGLQIQSSGGRLSLLREVFAFFTWLTTALLVYIMLYIIYIITYGYMIISIHTRTLKSQLNNSCCPPMSCRGPMSHLDFLGRVRISYKSTSITGGHHLVLSIEPCSWIEACSWMKACSCMKDIRQSLRAECSRSPCQANMAPIEIPT